MTGTEDQGGEAPCFAHLFEEPDEPAFAPSILAANTIIYCDDWAAVVEFYRSGLGLPVNMERDWFVEFELKAGAHLSVADASRATVPAGYGAGLTLSWRVADLDATLTALSSKGIDVSETRTRWGSDYFYVSDPAGNRIEFWAVGPEDSSPDTTP